MKRTKEEAEKTRQDIVDAGLIMFGKKGIESTRVEDIAREAGVTRGAFYYHFKNKYDLYIHLLKLRADYYNRIIGECMNSEQVSILKIRSYMVDVLLKHANDKKFSAFNEMILHKSEKIDDMLKTMKESEKERIIPTGLFIETIDEGKSDGSIKSEISTGYVVMAIFIFIQGAILFSMANKDRFSLEEKAEGLVDSFLIGVVDQ